MGIENMRRWPMYIVFAFCVMLFISLLNSWSIESELQNRISDLSKQLQECSKQQSTCMEDSLSLLEQRNGYVLKIKESDNQHKKLNLDITEYQSKIKKLEKQVNHTISDEDSCKKELQSFKNLQISVAAKSDLQIETLTTQLSEKQKQVEELELEIVKLKSSLVTKSVSNIPAALQVSPAASPPKLSPAVEINNAINEPDLDNDAKEDIEDINAFNGGNEFDPPVQH